MSIQELRLENSRLSEENIILKNKLCRFKQELKDLIRRVENVIKD